MFHILPAAIHWIRAGAPTTVAATTPFLFGTAHNSGTYTVSAYPDIVFYDVGTCLTEPPTSPAAILASAERPDASCIVLCTTRAADRCRCGGNKLADLVECVCCAIVSADAQETEWVPESEEETYDDDDDDYGVCANCFRTYTGDGFHGFCGPSCAAVRGIPICHCCYE